MDSASKGFDFAASDDILCSFEDYTNQDNSNGTHSDSAIANNSSKEFHKTRMSRPSTFPASSCNPPDDSSNQDVIILAVERSMKKYSDHLMRFLEGLSSRLSQLELYCYNIDKSIGEMRSDLARDHGESEAKLKFLEKHLQEVHRSIQIIKDKQELADTQKELAKIQLAQKESSSGQNSQKSEETASSDTKKNDNINPAMADGHNQQLALTVTAQPQMPAAQPMSQSPAYYLPSGPTQLTQPHYLPPEPHYQTTPPPPRSQAAQPSPQPQIHPLPPYQHQWAQPPQPTIRPSSPQVFPYHPTQQPNPSTPEMTYGYGGSGGSGQAAQPQPPQLPPHLKAAFGGQSSDGYTYMMYDGDGSRVPPPTHQTHFPQGVYPSNPPPNTSGSMVVRPPQQFIRNHPHNELIDKLGSMGFRGDHVMNVIQRLEESGQTVDFNAVLDRLNVHPSGAGPQRGWSG